MIVQNNKEISVLPLSCLILDERVFFYLCWRGPIVLGLTFEPASCRPA